MKLRPISPSPEHQEAVSSWLGACRSRHDREGVPWEILFNEGLSALQDPDGCLGRLPADYRQALEAWIHLGAEAGYFVARGDEPRCARLPTPADLDHSSLLPRLLAGTQVFHHAPPTLMAHPWVSLVANRQARLSISKDHNPLDQALLGKPGEAYLSLSQSTFRITAMAADGWVHATSHSQQFVGAEPNTFWKIRARQAELGEVEYEEAKRRNDITGSFADWQREWPYRVWEIQVLNPPEECATYPSIEEILARLRPRVTHGYKELPR